MQNKTRSILDEIDGLIGHRDKEHLVESRATNVIAGAINLLSYIRENFDPTQAADLEKRFINSIRSGDPQKFVRGMRRIKKNEDQ